MAIRGRQSRPSAQGGGGGSGGGGSGGGSLWKRFRKRVGEGLDVGMTAIRRGGDWKRIENDLREARAAADRVYLKLGKTVAALLGGSGVVKVTPDTPGVEELLEEATAAEARVRKILKQVEELAGGGIDPEEPRAGRKVDLDDPDLGRPGRPGR